MWNHFFCKPLGRQPSLWHFRVAVWVYAFALLCGSVLSWAQDQQAPAQAPSTAPAQNPDSGKPKQDVPAEAGGPGESTSPYSIPRKSEEAPPPPPPPATPKKVEGIPDYSLKVNVPLVNVDVLVTTKNGQFVPGLKKDNFRILEDGVPQAVSNFNVAQAPITAVLLTEFASTNYVFMIQAL